MFSPGYNVGILWSQTIPKSAAGEETILGSFGKAPAEKPSSLNYPPQNTWLSLCLGLSYPLLN